VTALAGFRLLHLTSQPTGITMLYATLKSGNELYGHVADIALRNNLNLHYDQINEIQADGDELDKCCYILGRNLPTKRVYTFLGNNAREIAKNWD
jgi:hypothetical protein